MDVNLLFELLAVCTYYVDSLSINVEPTSTLTEYANGNITILYSAYWEYAFNAFEIHTTETQSVIGYLVNIKECEFHSEKARYIVNITCQDQYLEGTLVMLNIDMADDNRKLRFVLHETKDSDDSGESTEEKTITLHVQDKKSLEKPKKKIENNDVGTKLSPGSKGLTEIMDARMTSLDTQNVFDSDTKGQKLSPESYRKSDVSEQTTSEFKTSTTSITKGESQQKVNSNLVIILTTSGLAIAIVIGGIMAVIKVKIKANKPRKKRNSSKECRKEGNPERRNIVDGGYKDNVLYIPFELDTNAQSVQIINQRVETSEQHIQEEALRKLDTNRNSEDLFVEELAAEGNDVGTPEVLYTRVNKRNKQSFSKDDAVRDGDIDDENVGLEAVVGKADDRTEPLYSQVNKKEKNNLPDQNQCSIYENAPEVLYSTVNKGRNGIRTKILLEEDEYENSERLFSVINDVPRIPNKVKQCRTQAKPIPKPRKKKT